MVLCALLLRQLAAAYLLTVKLVPTWVPGSHRLFMALLPYSGYYAHHPFREQPWHVPVEVDHD